MSRDGSASIRYREVAYHDQQAREQATPTGSGLVREGQEGQQGAGGDGIFKGAHHRRSDWKINVLPWFGRDTAALFTNAWFRDEAERRMAARYRWYVLGYVVLLAGFLWLP